MADRSQTRPRFRFGPMIRPIQAMGPPPPPTPAPQPAAAPLPRLTMIRPPFMPPVAAPPPQLPSVTTTRKSPIPAPPGTRIAPPSSPVIRGSFPDSRASLVARRSPSNVSPVPQKSPPHPATPVSRRSPPSSPLGSRGTGKYSSSEPKTRSPPHSILSSPSIKQEIAKSVPYSPPKQSTPKYVASPSVPRATKSLPKTLPESPNIKHAPRSPPSFSLPPSQLHSDGDYEREIQIPSIAEQKTVKPRSFTKPHRDNLKNYPAGINSKSKEGETKRSSNREDSGMSVITISGENRGAVMELGYSPGTHSTPHQRRSNGESSKGDLSSKDEGRFNRTAKAIPSKPMHAFMNNNVQGTNSSILFNSTMSFHDPGIHFRLSRKPDNGHLKDHANGQNLFSN